MNFGFRFFGFLTSLNLRRRRFVIVAGGVFLISAGAVAWLNSAPATSHDGVVTIPLGTPALGVAGLLEDAGHIRSRLWFLLLTELRGAAEHLQAGSYAIQKGRTAAAILNDLVSGRTRKIRLTVPEGFASWQIAERLEKQNICSAEEFRRAVASAFAEGYLFPETYYLDETTPAVQVRHMMKDHFEKAWTSVVNEAITRGAVLEAKTAPTPSNETLLRLADGRSWTRSEIVTLASIIEREAILDEERPVVSAVYHNRLKKRMPLESDPTVQFSLGYWKERILYRDLNVSSPYNTYRRRGLPPGPICSPGRASLTAALAPAPVDYLYFVANESGGHWFSKTFDEHRREIKRRNGIRRDRRRQKQ